MVGLVASSVFAELDGHTPSLGCSGRRTCFYSTACCFFSCRFRFFFSRDIWELVKKTQHHHYFLSEYLWRWQRILDFIWHFWGDWRKKREKREGTWMKWDFWDLP